METPDPTNNSDGVFDKFAKCYDTLQSLEGQIKNVNTDEEVEGIEDRIQRAKDHCAKGKTHFKSDNGKKFKIIEENKFASLENEIEGKTVEIGRLERKVKSHKAHIENLEKEIESVEDRESNQIQDYVEED